MGHNSAPALPLLRAAAAQVCIGGPVPAGSGAPCGHHRCQEGPRRPWLHCSRVPWVGGEQVPRPHTPHPLDPAHMPLNSCCLGLPPLGRAPPLNVKSLMTVWALPSHQTPRVRHSPVSTSPPPGSQCHQEGPIPKGRTDSRNLTHSPKGTDHAPSNVHQAAAVPQTWGLGCGRWQSKTPLPCSGSPAPDAASKSKTDPETMTLLCGPQPPGGVSQKPDSRVLLPHLRPFQDLPAYRGKSKPFLTLGARTWATSGPAAPSLSS